MSLEIVNFDAYCRDNYGDPSFCLGNLHCWVYGRARPNELGWWGDLLNANFVVNSSSSGVIAGGSILHCADISDWVNQIISLLDGSSTELNLGSIENNLLIKLIAEKRGTFSGSIAISPTSGTESHVYEVSLDRFDIQNFLDGSRSVLEIFPSVSMS